MQFLIADPSILLKSEKRSDPSKFKLYYKPKKLINWLSNYCILFYIEIRTVVNYKELALLYKNIKMLILKN